MAAVTPESANLATRRERVATRRWTVPAVIDKGIRLVCFACAAVSVVATLGIIVLLFKEALDFFRLHSIFNFLTGSTWTPSARNPQFGVLPLVVGTLWIMVGSGLVAIPLGLLVGVYLSEYAPTKVRRILKPVLELLAGVPSVVFGFFALTLITPLLRSVFPGMEPSNAAAGAIVVGFMTLPMVASLCEDALASVPKQLREASYGLGATKAETTLRIVLPAATSGVVAAFILALSRAVGETMAVTLAAGASPRMTLNPGESIMTMTAQIVNFSKGDLSRGQIEYQTIFAIGITLFAVTLGMNLLAQRIVRKFSRTGL